MHMERIEINAERNESFLFYWQKYSSLALTSLEA